MKTDLSIVVLQPFKQRQVISFDFMIEDIINHGDLTSSYKPFSGFYSEDKIPLIEGDNVLCKGLNNNEELSGIITFDKGSFSLLVVDPPKDGSFDNGSLPAMYNFEKFTFVNISK